MRSPGARAPQRLDAVLVHGISTFRDLRYRVNLVLTWIELAHSQVRRDLVEHGRVAHYFDIVIDDERKPDQVVRETCAHAPAGIGMPPVLNVPFFELPRRRPDDLI